jgi:DNA-binding MarR family transcriptional regulator
MTDQNIERLAKIFPGIMHFFHNIAGQVSRVGEFTLAQYRVLMLLFTRGALNINALKDELRIAQSSASGMIDRLMAQDLVIREKLPSDRRVTVLKLTPKAEKIIKTRMQMMTEVYRKILQDFSSEEGAILLDSLEKISEILQQKNQTINNQEKE